MPDNTSPSNTIPRVSPPVALGYCFLNWLIPGAGYLMVGNIARGLTLFVLVNALFLIGIGYGGFIIYPVFWPKDPGFNIVAILTYITQAFHGGGWLGLQWLHEMAGNDQEAYFHAHRMGTMPYSDLGVFHLIVAGALNYAATTRLYDLLAGNKELTESIPQREVAAKTPAEEGTA